MSTCPERCNVAPWITALVHHTKPTTRDAFADWLHLHPKWVRSSSHQDWRNRANISAPNVLRAWLILFEKPIQVRGRNVLTITERNGKERAASGGSTRSLLGDTQHF